jgi:UDPglucose--hexose-1-phosphate uridylyltransferase
MADFEFIQNKISGKWVVSAPRRSKRTNVGDKNVAVCPFCPGKEAHEEELYRVGGSSKDSNWKIRVIPNKFPFTPHHEIVIHSPDHHKNFDELAFEQVTLIFQTYKERFNSLKDKGQVYIFHNRGHAAGESLPHPHTQITVVPNDVHLEIPPLDTNVIARSLERRSNLTEGIAALPSVARNDEESVLETDHFLMFCPTTSEWSDEVWIAPKHQNAVFGEATDVEIKDIAFVVSRLIQIYDLRHGYEFPFNFYIAPGKNWYLRLIPRSKILGGFELGTQIIVNTQDPKVTFAFIREHFWEPNAEKIKEEHQAEYLKSV